MTREEFFSLKDYAKSIGLFVQDKGWATEESFVIRLGEHRQCPAILDYTYTNQPNVFGMPKRFSKNLLELLVSIDKKVYYIKETKQSTIKKKLYSYVIQAKKLEEKRKIKELKKDFK